MEALTLVHCQYVYCQFLGHLQMVSTWQCPKGYEHMAYRVELAEQLIGGFASRRSTTQKRITHANIVDNLLSHELIHGHQKQPKRCIPHKIYKPNQKNHKETVYTCV